MNSRVLNTIAFVVLMVSTAFSLQLLWGLLFLYWTIANFYSGHAFLLSDVSREENPGLFWAVQLAWIVLGGLMVVSDLYLLIAHN